MDEHTETRQDIIHSKGFDLFDFNYTGNKDDPQINEYNKIKVGLKQLEDAVLELGTLRQARLPYCNKRDILNAIV